MQGDIKFKILNSRIRGMTEEIRRLREENGRLRDANRRLRDVCDIFDYTPADLQHNAEQRQANFVSEDAKWNQESDQKKSSQ